MTKKKTRPYKDKQTRRSEILRVAEDLFTTKGFAATKIDDLVKAVGVSHGTFYYHFPTKEDLIRAFADSRVKKFGEQIEKWGADPSLSSQDQFVKMVDAVERFRGLRTTMAKLRGGTIDEDPMIYQTIVSRIHGDVAAMVAEVIRDGIEAGEFDVPDPDGTALMISMLSLDLIHCAVTIEEQLPWTQMKTTYETNVERLLGVQSGESAPRAKPRSQRVLSRALPLLVGLILMLFLFLAPMSEAYDYEERTGGDNPFDGIDIGSGSAPSLHDLDADGDLDLILGNWGGTLQYYENTGTTNSPAYTERTGGANPCDGIDVGSGSSPTLADIDGDGDLDLVVGDFSGGYAELHYYENTGTTNSPAYTERTGAANPFNGLLSNLSYELAPSFADIDNDGDFDLVAGEYSGGLYYLENTGTTNAPVYVQRTGGANPFGGLWVFYSAAPGFTDIDGDGDLDMVVGEDGYGWPAGLTYYENTGTPDAPAYKKRTGPDNPFDGFTVQASTKISFGDIDGDGLDDAAVSCWNGAYDLKYFKGYPPLATVVPTLAPMEPALISGAFIINLSTPAPAGGIVINYEITTRSTAIKDADYSALSGSVPIAASSQTAVIPVLPLADGVIDPSETIVMKLLPGAGYRTSERGSGVLMMADPLALAYVERTGGANPFNGIAPGFVSAAARADLDGDGDFDVVIGNQHGTIDYYENTGDAATPVYVQRTGGANPFNGVDVGQHSMPALADLDEDGDFDAVVGEISGGFIYFENTGTTNVPAFTKRTGSGNPFDGLDVGDFSAPAFADIDGDGDPDVLAGTGSGVLMYLVNTSTTNSSAFSISGSNPLNGVDVGNFSTPAITDLDGDGDWDVVIGEYKGGLHYFENTGNAASPTFIERIGSANPFDAIDKGFHSEPTLADLDDDGDQDAAVGESLGQLAYFENTATAYGNLPFVDTDGDLLADWMESLIFGSSISDPDSDGDGMLDYDEAHAGTSLTNPASLFRIGSISEDSGTNLVIKWSSVSGKSYELHYSEDLVGNVWTQILSNIPGSPPTNTATVAGTTNNVQFYRIRTE